MASLDRKDDRLDGWDAIARYMGWNPRTLIRWEKLKGLPVHRVAGGKRQPVYAFRHEIDEWFRTNGGGGTIALVEAVEPESELASGPPLPANAARRISRAVIFISLGLCIVVVSAAGIGWRTLATPVFEITNVTQLTADGSAKRNLVTDGRQLYFSEEVGDKEELSAMAVTGGLIRRIVVPFPNAYPEDISPDGKSLLVLSEEGPEEEHPLWVVASNGDPSERDLGVRCHAASWSPDGNWIAFGSGEGIGVISSEGKQMRQLRQFGGIPQKLQWSADGRHLVFFLRDSASGTPALWEMALDERLNAKLADPLKITGNRCCDHEYLSRGEGGYFSVTNDGAGERPAHLRQAPWWQTESFEFSPLGTRFDAINDVAADAAGRRIFVLNGTREQGELVRYDPSTKSYTPMLPGKSATYVDFSRQGDRLAFVEVPNQALWVSRADGSEARRLSPSGLSVQLPRWSPDGKSIAFMGKRVDRPYRIFVLSVIGGTLKEASEGDDNQGAPTWSRDGRFLLYGNVLCQHDHTCAIHKIDLTSGKTTIVPESQGLGTARWSPNGQYIAALDSAHRALTVFDMAGQRWRTLANGINGNDVSWSSDSLYVYTKSSMTGHAEILRVPVTGGAAQTVLNLEALSKSPGQLDTWFSLTPDNALILNRWLNASEIFALNYRGQ